MVKDDNRTFDKSSGVQVTCSGPMFVRDQIDNVRINNNNYSERLYCSNLSLMTMFQLMTGAQLSFFLLHVSTQIPGLRTETVIINSGIGQQPFLPIGQTGNLITIPFKNQTRLIGINVS